MKGAFVFKVVVVMPSLEGAGWRNGWIQCRMGLRMEKEGKGPSRSILTRR